MGLDFAVAKLNICNKRLLGITFAVHKRQKNTCGNEPQKSAVHIGFWKLCVGAVHVDMF